MTKWALPCWPEVRARAVRMVLDRQGEHASQWAAVAVPARRLAGDIDEHRGAYGVEPICKVLPAKSQRHLSEIAQSA